MSSKGYIKRGQLRIQKKLNTTQLIFKDMREEYDFSKRKRGIYSRDLKDLHFPVYLDPKLEEYYKK
ncbi:hypothetical protein BUQ74_10385 [Leptospira weilii serovar Heyan]|nr:hypothetical protein BUQ74_10385 [Leptospira weilii serovar Heyan]